MYWVYRYEPARKLTLPPPENQVGIEIAGIFKRMTEEQKQQFVDCLKFDLNLLVIEEEKLPELLKEYKKSLKNNESIESSP